MEDGSVPRRSTPPTRRSRSAEFHNFFRKGMLLSCIHIESSIMTSLSAFGVVSDLLFETFIEEKG